MALSNSATASKRQEDQTRKLQETYTLSTAAAIIGMSTPPAATKLSRIWSDQSSVRSLSYDESCCLHLANGIECNDPDFCHGPISLTSFDFTNYLVRISASEHRQLVHRPVPVVVISWPHRRVQINFPIFGEFQSRRPAILYHVLDLLHDFLVAQFWQVR